MKTVLINGCVITPFVQIEHGGVCFEDGKIESVFEGAYSGSARVCIDVNGQYIAPGLVDIHTHGGGGYDYMDGTEEAIIGAARLHLTHGTTSIVPTTLTCPDEELLNLFSAFRAAKNSGKAGANLLGLHLEGPYFSPLQAGAQDSKYLKQPENDHYIAILNATNDIIRWSVAPELPGALNLGRELSKRGILASIGHSDAEYAEVATACLNGYTHVTHLYSGMSALRRVGPYRHLGIVESAYLCDELSVEIIADGCHLPPELLRMIVKCKPIDKICLVTDSMRGAGMPEGSIVRLGSSDKGQKVIIEDGVAMLLDYTAFAGSVCTADRCIRTMYQKAGVPLKDAIRMMSYNPAQIIGAVGKGALTPGNDADIIVFDDNIRISQVFVGGDCLFESTEIM